MWRILRKVNNIVISNKNEHNIFAHLRINHRLCLYCTLLVMHELKNTVMNILCSKLNANAGEYICSGIIRNGQKCSIKFTQPFYVAGSFNSAIGSDYTTAHITYENSTFVHIEVGCNLETVLHELNKYKMPAKHEKYSVKCALFEYLSE